MRGAKLFVLAFVAVLLSFGSAWAEVDYGPRIYWSHSTRSVIVDGKVDYNPAGSSENDKPPSFLWMYLEVDNTGSAQSGSVTVNARHPAYVWYEDGNTGDVIDGESFTGEKTFSLWTLNQNNGYLYAGDENGNEALWGDKDHKETETAFSGQPFWFTVGAGEFSAEGITPSFRTTEEQMESGCVPYLELITDEAGKMLTGVKWRFVDYKNPSAAVKRNDSNYDIRRVTQIQYRLKDNSRVSDRLDMTFDMGESIEGESTLTKPLPLDEIAHIRQYFTYEDGVADYAHIEYNWRFYLSDADVPEPKPQPIPEPPTEEEVEEAKEEAEKNLGVKPTEVIAAENGKIKTNDDIIFADGGVRRSHTSSAIAINQSVAPGGAVVLASELTLPMNSKSLSGLDLPKPKNFEELKKHYSVLKYFEKGGPVNLLEEFGSRIFSYSEDDGVILNAIVVIIDDAAPAEDVDDEIIRPYGNKDYGVKLSADDKYLYIYDGVKNGVASDPIALVKEDDDAAVSSGSSGCDAGFGVLVLLALAVPVAFRRR